jgi:transposase
MVYLQFERRRVRCRQTGKVKQEPVEWISTTPGYTKRFAYYVGKRCQSSTIKEVAEELHLNWKTVKNLEKEYMAEKLRRGGASDPEIIGIDEISVRKGHEYRIIISDLKNKRPIWFGGVDRSKESLDSFYQTLNSLQKGKIRLVVMDMWKAFEKSTQEHLPEAAILYDKFHVIRHLNKALDEVRKQEYKQASEQERKYIKGKKYILLSREANLSTDGKNALAELCRKNKRLNTAYLLKENFDQLWSYRREGWARRFFDQWKESLKWQRLEPYKKFAGMIERHWEGIAEYCKPKNKISLGYVEGLNNKIRVIQRRAYGLRDEEYLRLKILTCTLPDFNP